MLYQIQFIRQIHFVLLAFSLLAGMQPGFATVMFAQELGSTKTKNQPDRWDRQLQLTNATVRAEERVYKSTAQGDLRLHIWSPKTDGEGRPCIVFFFGGGWHSGTYRQFARQSAYLANRGMVAASAEYRIRKLHNTTPDARVEDAKSAIRWVRAHAKELGIESSKVIAAGGSADGHLAAATALVPGFDAEGEDRRGTMVRSRPRHRFDHLRRRHAVLPWRKMEDEAH